MFVCIKASSFSFKAAGGLSHDLTPTECIIKECEEEAHIARELSVNKLKSVGALRYDYYEIIFQ
jgi:hypothetical protein